MPPDDPLGRNGPKLDRFLRKVRADCTSSSAPPCPYGKKCTYGNKCKYYHPERGNVPQKTITERLAEQAQRHLLEVKARNGQVHTTNHYYDIIIIHLIFFKDGKCIFYLLKCSIFF